MAYYLHKAGYISSTMLSLGEFKFSWVDKLRYLGVYFVNNPNRMLDVQEQITKFYGSVHSILTYCGINIELELLELLKSKCDPVLFYGLVAMFINFKIREAISKFRIGPCVLFLVLKVVKVLDNYYITAISCHLLIEYIIYSIIC